MDLLDDLTIQVYITGSTARFNWFYRLVYINPASYDHSCTMIQYIFVARSYNVCRGMNHGSLGWSGCVR